MKRIEIEKPGGLENLKFVDAEQPKPQSDEVLLKVSHSFPKFLKVSQISQSFFKVGGGGVPTPTSSDNTCEFG